MPPDSTTRAGVATRGREAFWITFAAMSLAGAIATTVFLSRDALYSTIVFADTPDVIQALGGVDPANYLRLATDLAQGFVGWENRWILLLWPPGMPVVFAVLLLLPGPVVIKAAIMSVLLWSAVGAWVTAASWSAGGRARAILFAAFWVLGAGGIMWAYGPGVMYSDGIGAALVIAMLALVHHYTRATTFIRRLVFAGLAGAALGASLYFRWALLGLVVIFVAAVGVTLLFALLAYIRRHQRESLARVQIALVFLLGVGLLVMPWTLVASFKLHPGNPTWSNGDYTWSQRWLTDEQLEAAPFLTSGNANWACEIDVSACEELNEDAQDWTTADLTELRDRALLAAVENPGPFVANRFDALWRGWFAGPGQDMTRAEGMLSGIATLIALAYLIFATFRRPRAQRLFKSAIWLTLAGIFSVIMVAHVEARYLLPATAVIWTGVALIAVERPFPWLSARLRLARAPKAQSQLDG